MSLRTTFATRVSFEGPWRVPQWLSPVMSTWSSQQTVRVLVVDDDVNLMRLLRTVLRTAGFDVTAVGDGYEALLIAGQETFDVIILDLLMPGVDGRAVFAGLRSQGVRVPVLIASAYGAHTAQLELGAEGAIEKPFDPDRLIDAVNDLVRDYPRATVGQIE